MAAAPPATAAKEQTPTATTHRNRRMTIATSRSARSHTLRGYNNTGSHWSN
jgi:hypothetical protein